MSSKRESHDVFEKPLVVFTPDPPTKLQLSVGVLLFFIAIPSYTMLLGLQQSTFPYTEPGYHETYDRDPVFKSIDDSKIEFFEGGSSGPIYQGLLPVVFLCVWAWVLGRGSIGCRSRDLMGYFYLIGICFICYCWAWKLLPLDKPLPYVSAFLFIVSGICLLLSLSGISLFKYKKYPLNEPFTPVLLSNYLVELMKLHGQSSPVNNAEKGGNEIVATKPEKQASLFSQGQLLPDEDECEVFPEPPYSLDSHIVYVRESAKLDVSCQIYGECYAYHYEGLRAEAEENATSIHNLLLNRIISGLWDAAPKYEVYVFYEALNNINRMFICSTHKLGETFFRHVHPKLSQTGGYIESGYTRTQLSTMRPLVKWEPPCHMIALWPKGQNGDTNGYRVIDTGTLLGYYSYEDASGYQRIMDKDLTNPDYLCVPAQQEAEFQHNSKKYRFTNRFYEIQP